MFWTLLISTKSWGLSNLILSDNFHNLENSSFKNGFKNMQNVIQRALSLDKIAIFAKKSQKLPCS